MKRISDIFLMPLDFLKVSTILSLERKNPFFFSYVVIQVLLNEMRRYPSIKTRCMINCQTMIKMMLKRDKESVVGKLKPAKYPFIKIVDEIRKKSCTSFLIIAEICEYKKGEGGVNHL